MNYRAILKNDHPACVINDIVDYVGTDEIEATYNKVGNPAYHPRMMVKILIYGDYQGYYGGRPLYNNFKTDLGLRYLTADKFPDHRTINEFRIKFKNEFADIFTKVVIICVNLGLVAFENLAIDSQKIKANANLFQNKNIKGIGREMEKIKAQIIQIQEQEANTTVIPQQLQRKHATLEHRDRKIQDALKILKEAGGEASNDIRYNLTDPESKVMTDKTGAKHPDYLCHNAVDDKCQVITGIKVTNIPTDAGQLMPLKEESKKNTGRPHKNTEADCGYSTAGEYRRMAADTETQYYVPDRTMRCSKNDPYSKWNFIYSREDDAFFCSQARPLYLKRIGKDQFGEEYFVYESEDCSGCPVRDLCLKKMKVKEGDGGEESPPSNCQNRTITIYSEDELKRAMREKLDSEEGKKIYQRRMSTVELVHGDMQLNRGFTQFHLRGLDKVTVEYVLLVIAHNIRKIILHGFHAFQQFIHGGQSTPVPS